MISHLMLSLGMKRVKGFSGQQTEKELGEIPKTAHI